MLKKVYEQQPAIDGYFESCRGEPLTNECGDPMLDKAGRPMFMGQKPPTLTGLALALECASRRELMNYLVHKDCTKVVKCAVSRIEDYAEQRMFDKDVMQGAKFILTNNFKGWRDKPGDDESEVIRRLDEVMDAMGSALDED